VISQDVHVYWLSGSLSPWYSTSLGCRWRNCGQLKRDGRPGSLVGQGPNSSSLLKKKKRHCYELLHRALDLVRFFRLA
jgi:hypothetical protein